MLERIEFSTFADLAMETWSGVQGLVVFLGENGAGKSRLLAQIEQQSVRAGLRTFAIANTPYDKFKGPAKGSNRLLARNGRNAPERNIKRAISGATDSDGVALRRISRALRHCGYLPDVGISVKLRKGAKYGLRTMNALDRLPSNEQDELSSICNVLLRSDFPVEPIWFDFDGVIPEYSYHSVIPKILRWERLLKEVGIVRRIDLSLRRSECEIPLASASSGELSLISTLAYLASVAGEAITILVDEPENSLHPRWQREYLGLLLEAVKYRGGCIVVATHSPLIVSSAFTEAEGSFFPQHVRTIVLSSTYQKNVAAPPSVEGILAEAFNLVTPANHYLSQSLIRILDEVDKDPSRRVHAHEEIHRLRASMPDVRQEKVLDAVSSLIDRVGRE